MKSLGLISQVLTIGLSVAIALLYIRPTFEEIAVIQSDIAQYQEQRAKIEQVNQDLARHVATLESIPENNIERLTTYMPRFVDDIAVMRDLQFMVDQSGLILKDLTYGEVLESDLALAETDVPELAPTPHQFTVIAEGTYGQVKNLFRFLEQNEYPLEVVIADVQPLEGGFLSLELVLVTYADDIVPLEVS